MARLFRTPDFVLLKTSVKNSVFSKYEVVRCCETSSHETKKSSLWDTAKPFSEIPSMPMLPFLGTAWHFMPVIGRFTLERHHLANREKRRLLGDVFREKVGSLDIVMSFRAEDLETIFRNEGGHPHRTEFSSIKAYRESRRQWYKTNGLLALNGPEWKELRSKTQKHMLRPNAALSYIYDMQDIAKDLIKRIEEKKDSNDEFPELMNEIYKWALESIGFFGLNARLGCLDNDLSPDSDGMRMINSVLTQFECMHQLEAFAGNIQFWKFFPTFTWKRFVKASDVYTEISFKYINNALKDLKLKEKENKEVVRLTFLQNLFREGLDVHHAMVTVSDLLMAGIETTSHAAGFLLYHLATNPDKQERLYEEIIKFLPNKTDKITESLHNELRYLKACIKESLRLKPIVTGTARVLSRDVVLGGYQVPAGTLVAVGFQEISLNKKYHLHPDRFIPERWLDRTSRSHPFAVLPFGVGSRSCIGRRIAELEIFCLTTEVIRNYYLQYNHEVIDIITKLVSMPDKPLKIKFITR